jgi:hypothetical protein
MIRNLKALGLALVAVLAISAIAASASQAANLTVDTYPATLSWTSAETDTAFDSFGASVTCPGATFSATLAAASKTLTATPKYTQSIAAPCHVGTLPATVTLLGGCTFQFHLVEPQVSEHTWKVTTDICPTGGSIVIDVYGSKAGHEANTPICTQTIATQAGLAGLHVTETTGVAPVKNDLDLVGTLSNISVTQVRNSAFCPTGTSTTEGKFTITKAITITAKNTGGVVQNLDIG